MAVRAPALVGIGLVTLDQIGIAPRSRDATVELNTFSVQAGGPVGTALATAAAFGTEARLFSRLGDDAFGRTILHRLRSFGIDTSAVRTERGRMSPVSFILVDEEGGRRFVRFTRGDVTPLTARDLPAGLLAEAKMLYLDGAMPAVQIAAAERARATGVRVFLDVRRVDPGLGELLSLSDIVVASERVASEFSHTADLERTLVELTRLGPELAVLTLGDEGAIALHKDKLVRQQALPVKVLDVTGAGSVFRGALAHTLLKRWPLERALPFANAAAALNCQSLGGQSGIPTPLAVKRAMAT